MFTKPNCHTALSHLDKLPDQTPPLHEIRDGICPIRGSYYLLPRGTLNEFAARVSAYGKHLVAVGTENLLQFRDFLDSARRHPTNARFDDGFTGRNLVKALAQASGLVVPTDNYNSIPDPIGAATLQTDHGLGG